jgi:hypothetical protein
MQVAKNKITQSDTTFVNFNYFKVLQEKRFDKKNPTPSIK